MSGRQNFLLLLYIFYNFLQHFYNILQFFTLHFLII